MIDVGKNYSFEFTTQINENNSFIGNEFLCGRLTNKLLNNLFPNNNISFFPIIPTRFDQTIMIQNLQNKNFFNQFDHILIDWPLEFTPHLSKICKSFPTPLCLTNKHVFEAGIFEKKDKTNPIYFIESYNTRRQIIQNFESKNITCVGGLRDCLQWSLSHQKNESAYLLTNGLLPWLQAQFLTHTTEEILPVTEDACRKILQFISLNPTLKILIVADFKLLIGMDQKIQDYNPENNVVHLNKPETLYLSRPTNESCLEYSHLNGFISRQITADNKIDNWLELLKNYLTKLFLNTEEKYTEWTKMNVSVSEQRDFFRFAYRLALEKHRYFLDSFDLLLAAKSVVNSNFAYEMHKELNQFPTHPAYENTLKQIELPLESFFDKTQKISLQKFATIQSQKPTRKTKLQSVHKNRPLKHAEATSEEKYADNNWVNEDHPYSCSFPNEDIFMEKLAFDVKKNMKERVKDKEQVYRELQSDFCDGLDLKETIRNWHKDKIIVKETLNVGKADIGAVIFGFAQSHDDEKFSWKSFWLAEQHDDSHLMFYATPFKDNLIGPGVAKSEFGGFAVIPLDSYIEHPWNHPYILTHAQNCTECLILAGALSSNHKSILFISLHPPSQHIIKILKQSGKNIIYARLDEFSQTDIRRVRTFHILAESGVRAYAQKYIRKD